MEEENPGVHPGRRAFLRTGLAATAAALAGARVDAASPRASAGLRITSLLTAEPVPGARVRLAGREIVADAAGRVPVGSAFAWSPVEVEADGFLLRRTCLREGGDLTLWSADAVPADVLRELVYAEGRLMRPVAGDVDVVPHGALAEHGACVGSLSAACARATDDLQVGFAVTTPEKAPVPSAERPRIDVLVDRADPLVAAGARAVFYRRTRGATVIGGRIVLASCHVAHDERTLLHELGHVMLGHSPVAGDLMAPDSVKGEPADGFSRQERLVLQLVRERQPGNLPQDDDLDLGPSPDRVALGTLVHRLVYAPGLHAGSVFAATAPRLAGARRQSLVCAA